MKNKELQTVYLFVGAIILLGVLTIGVNAAQDYRGCRNLMNKHCVTVVPTSYHPIPTKTMTPTASNTVTPYISQPTATRFCYAAGITNSQPPLVVWTCNRGIFQLGYGTLPPK
jgi:hypothetical protein